MASMMIAKTRTTESDTLENRPRCRNRHSSIQAATPVAAMAKRVHTAMSRWELITAFEIPGTPGSVSAHIDALPVDEGRHHQYGADDEEDEARSCHRRIVADERGDVVNERKDQSDGRKVIDDRMGMRP